MQQQKPGFEVTLLLSRVTGAKNADLSPPAQITHCSSLKEYLFQILLILQVCEFHKDQFFSKFGVFSPYCVHLYCLPSKEIMV